MKVKVVGAGSIGNHLSHAARKLGWAVDLVDIDPAALDRARNEIYPARYGGWDDAIGLHAAGQAPVGGHDMILIGTPPDTHMTLARAAIAERPRALLVEKPLCGPDLAGAQDLRDEAAAAGVAVFVGYDHVVGRSSTLVGEMLASGRVGDIASIDVEFREHWGGIFAAHPWLAGPWESYLGFSARGGGALGEHSHAINLWQHFAHLSGAGRITEVDARLDFVRDARVDYDRICFMTFLTEGGVVGRCVQDVVTRPARKWARIQGGIGHVEWWCGREPGVDVVTGAFDNVVEFEQKVTKTRPDDFVEELGHIERALARDPGASPIALGRGLDTMLVIAAAHRAHAEGRRIAIDYAKGCSPAALSLI